MCHILIKNNDVVKGSAYYGQTIINIELSNKSIIRFTDNAGEVKENILPRFSII